MELDRILARVVWIRREGGAAAAAHLAPGGAPCRSLAGLRADERGDAQDSDLRTAARELRSARQPALVVGCPRARARSGDRALRRDLRDRADRHEAAARVFVDREH